MAISKPEPKKLQTPCLILAGGASRRFGADKASARLGDQSLAEHVYQRISAQTRAPIAYNAPVLPEGIRIKMDAVPDRLTGRLGPLAGIHAALVWAEGFGIKQVATVSVDTPFLPADVLNRLSEVGAPSFAVSASTPHSVCGLWRVSDAGGLEAYLKSGARKVMGWLQQIGAKPVMFKDEQGRDPFFNINTVEDLAQAEAWLS